MDYKKIISDKWFHYKWKSLDYDKMKKISNEEYEKVFLDGCFEVVKRDNKIHKSLFSCTKFQLQVYGCIQQENVIISINLSSKYNLIKDNLKNYGCNSE